MKSSSLWPNLLALEIRYSMARATSPLPVQTTTETGSPTQNPQSLVSFELKHGESLGTWIVPSTDLGWKGSSRSLCDYKYNDPPFTFPADVGGLIRQWTQEINPATALWLNVENDRGWLIATPWERLLMTFVNRPVLNLPFHPIEPVASVEPLEVLLCASSPQAKQPFDMVDKIQGFARDLLNMHSGQIRIHVFTDAHEYQRTTDALKAETFNGTTGRGVVVYNPQNALEYRPAERSRDLDESDRIRNPWLLWMQDSIKDVALDALHFICHGRMNVDTGCLAFAESPNVNEDRSWARFVGPVQLTRFATNCGVWSLGFTSVTNDFSPVALRFLANDVARARPGFTFIIDERSMDCRSEQQSMYQFVFRTATQPPASPNVRMYCHPSTLEPRTRSSSPSLESIALPTLESYTLASGSSGRHFERGSRPPSWFVASQRYLEQQVSAHWETSDQSLENANVLSPDVLNEGVKYTADVIREFTDALESTSPESMTTESSQESGEDARDTGESPGATQAAPQ